MFPYIEIFGRQFGTYGLCIAVAVFLVAALTIRDAGRVGIPYEDIIILGAIAMGFAFVCGTLLYIVVTYSWEQIVAWVRQGDFRFLNGGIVFYGGLIGGILGGWLGCKIAKRKMSELMPWVVPYIPLGHAIGRVGCVMAGCCHGYEYEGPLALHYPNSVTQLPPDQGYFPTQLLEAVLNIGLCITLVQLRKRCKRTSDLLFLYLGGYAIVRFCVEFFRGDGIRGVYGWFSTSQWISIGLLAVALIYGLWIRKKIEKNTQAD